VPTVRVTKSAIDAFAVSARRSSIGTPASRGFGRQGDTQRQEGLHRPLSYWRAGSRLRKYTIGPYGGSRSLWRRQAQKIFAARLDGRDPAAEKANSRRQLVVDRVDGLVETFITERWLTCDPASIASRMRKDVLRDGVRKVSTRLSGATSSIS